MQCYESEKLAEPARDSDFDHTNVALSSLNYGSIFPRSFINCLPRMVCVK